MGDHEMSGSRLRLAFGSTLVILLLEAGAGWLSHSLALLSDAGHILTDVTALALAWFAVEQAKRPADAKRPYGYHRVGILAATINGATLIVIVIFIAIGAARRFAHPEPVQGGLVILAALVAIGVNGFIAMGLREDGANVNVRAAWLHVLGDIGASMGVIVAGAIILLTGWYYADPLISVGIAALIASGALRIVSDTANVLLEGATSGLDLELIRATIWMPTSSRSAVTWSSPRTSTRRMESTRCGAWSRSCASGSGSATRPCRSSHATHVIPRSATPRASTITLTCM